MVNAGLCSLRVVRDPCCAWLVVYLEKVREQELALMPSRIFVKIHAF